jgi:hypothetical protein
MLGFVAVLYSIFMGAQAAFCFDVSCTADGLYQGLVAALIVMIAGIVSIVSGFKQRK